MDSYICFFYTHLAFLFLLYNLRQCTLNNLSKLSKFGGLIISYLTKIDMEIYFLLSQNFILIVCRKLGSLCSSDGSIVEHGSRVEHVSDGYTNEDAQCSLDVSKIKHGSSDGCTDEDRIDGYTYENDHCSLEVNKIKHGSSDGCTNEDDQCSSNKSISKHVGNGFANGDHDQGDRVSNLPASVLAHILSFLPIQEAVKTMQLRSFGSLWASIDNLHLNLCLSHDCNRLSPRDSDDFKFIDFVHQVLLLHQKSDIHRLHLSLRGLLHVLQVSHPSDLHPHELLKREKDLADMCIHFALKKEVKILALDFVACSSWDATFFHRGMYKVSDWLFSCDSLKQLNLVYCRVVAPEGEICMKSLQKLYLKYVRSDDSTVENLVSGCPMLESLYLIRCYGLQKLNFTSSNLKYVKVFHHTYSGLERRMLPFVVNLLRRSPFLETLEIQMHPDICDEQRAFPFYYYRSYVGVKYIYFVLHILFLCVRVFLH
ncbi:hypothetical protein Tsubulata_010748 [Turnera subulata]|uniref:F-box/LRR-repeat protein 15/At3g58940/PEG3-like LRR domain-containing protein n=1 Tax=Turnera subulata TaxID=218843 RepID=A0A9Q0JAE6_9ROSI|nr:hypothetical protein Tsubulata_010748 [Turnera subulata]